MAKKKKKKNEQDIRRASRIEFSDSLELWNFFPDLIQVNTPPHPQLPCTFLFFQLTTNDKCGIKVH